MDRLLKVVERGGASGTALGVVVAFATYYFVAALVGYLVAPLIAVFIGESHFELNYFEIDSVEFRYGSVIEAALSLAITVTVAYFAAAYIGERRADDAAVDLRDCPECTTPIPFAAKRCPHCTAVVVGRE